MLNSIRFRIALVVGLLLTTLLLAVSGVRERLAAGQPVAATAAQRRQPPLHPRRVSRPALSASQQQIEALGATRSHEIQRRLQDLGASYLLLESYGESSPRYRCYCQFDSAVAGPAFEAVDSDALRALERTLAQVESWMAAETPTALTETAAR